MHLLRYRGDICGVALFCPPLLVLLGLLGNWMGKGRGPCTAPISTRGYGWLEGCSALGHGDHHCGSSVATAVGSPAW